MTRRMCVVYSSEACRDLHVFPFRVAAASLAASLRTAGTSPRKSAAAETFDSAKSHIM